MSVEGLPETLRALDSQRGAYRRAIRDTILRLSMLMVGKVKDSKLSGQVLNVRTGRLRRSINMKLEETPAEVAGYVGTNVVYARPHEFGLTMDEQVKEHMRTATQAWGRMIKNPHATLVRAHVRHVTLPERSFLRSTLEEMQPQIKAELASAMENARGAGV